MGCAASMPAGQQPSLEQRPSATAPVNAPAAPAHAGPTFCMECGTPARQGAGFCSNCGTPAPATQPRPSRAGSEDGEEFIPGATIGAPPAPVVPPGHFKAQLPPGVAENQVVEVQVPAGYAQAGMRQRFRVPAGGAPQGFIYVPLPAAPAPMHYGGGGYGADPYGGGGYGGGGGPYGGGGVHYVGGGYQQQPQRHENNNGMAMGAGLLGGLLLGDMLF
mmetsp:Transcript_13254/g.32191  ORF Transcript_13254/g.32191 Transcript_13254/m.32191 type:complete len:218 (+) Transcript_13254:138-791(+)